MRVRYSLPGFRFGMMDFKNKHLDNLITLSVESG